MFPTDERLAAAAAVTPRQPTRKNTGWRAFFTDLEEAAAPSEPAFAVSGAAMSNIPQEIRECARVFHVLFLR